MKKLALALIMAITLVGKDVSAQQININNQPGWGPVGYDYVDFYYFPDFNIYFDLSREQYLIYRNGVWAYSYYVPANYRFDPYTAYKVIINESKPYLRNKIHIKEYAQFKDRGVANQPMIRDSRDNKYYASKGHPQNPNYEKQRSVTQRNTTISKSTSQNKSRIEATNKGSEVKKTNDKNTGRSTNSSKNNTKLEPQRGRN